MYYAKDRVLIVLNKQGAVSMSETSVRHKLLRRWEVDPMNIQRPAVSVKFIGVH